MAELTKAQLLEKLQDLEKQIEGGGETVSKTDYDAVVAELDELRGSEPKTLPAPPIATNDPKTLGAIAANARENAAEVQRIVNPTNIFASTFEALAKACEDLTALFNERGHTGIPEEYK